MRIVEVHAQNVLAGYLTEAGEGKYIFEYAPSYSGDPISLTMPVNQHIFHFDFFPPFFDGLLPEGPQLEGLLRQKKIDRHDYIDQLIAVGNDMVGFVTIKEVQE